MKQETISKVLKGFSVVAGLFGGLFFFWFMPLVVDEIILYTPEAEFLRWPSLIGMSAVALVCYYALYQFLKVCKQIGEKNSFCHENVLSMKNIGMSAVLVGLLIVMGNLYLLCVGWLHPSMIITSIFFIFIASAFAFI